MKVILGVGAVGGLGYLAYRYLFYKPSAAAERNKTLQSNQAQAQ